MSQIIALETPSKLPLRYYFIEQTYCTLHLENLQEDDDFYSLRYI